VGYKGLGAESVSPEVLAKFAPTPLPGSTSRRIQAMLDVRAPLGSRVAPDGKTLFFTWTVTGTPQIWRVDGPNRFPVQLTGGEDVTRLSEITPDGKWLIVTRDRKGEENPGLYLLSPKGGALVEVQHTAKVQTFFQAVTEDSKYLYYRANDRKPDAYALYRFDIATGRKELVFGEDGLWSIDDVRAEKDGRKLLLSKSTGALTAEYWELDERTKKLVPLFGQGEKEEYRAVYASRPGELVVSTPKFGNFRRLYRTRITESDSGKPLLATAAVAIGPELPHDVSAFSLDAPKKTLYFTTNEGGYTRAHALDASTYAEKTLPPVTTTPGTAEDHVTFGAPSFSGRFVIVNASAARHPTASFVLDWQSRKLEAWVSASTPELDTSTFAVPSLETYPARDGAKIPVFVRRPPACVKPAKPCPVVVHFHGGPEGQSLAGFSTYGQVFVDAGFIWVEPNVRGSDGYGKAWLAADDGPKRLGVVTDIEDAAKYARSAFTVNGQAPKVGVMGGSYGGYSTLIAMTKFAGAFDAGVANVGMSNLVTFLENTAPYRRALRISEYGDPQRDREALVQLSPITFIDRVRAPLLLIQGANDPRVPVGEALQMYHALESRGATTKMIVFPDEGHGTQKRENKVLEIGHTLDWFRTHLAAPRSGS
jgi:dipeptidyl aminopeptidase/acylaminoacyl peptidase